MRHRKIPSSTKHKKIKSVDPFYRGDRKDKKKKLEEEKEDAAPKGDPDDQPVPRKLLNIMRIQEKMAEGKVKKRRKPRHKKKLVTHEFGVIADLKEPGLPAAKGEPLPLYRKRIGETTSHFINRLHRDTQAMLQDAQLQDRLEKEEYKLNMNKEIQDKKREKKKKKKQAKTDEAEKKAGGEKSEKNESNEIAKSKKKKWKKLEDLRKLKVLEKLEDRIDDFAHLQDEVKFGEVVLQPPTLTFKPRMPKKPSLPLDTKVKEQRKPKNKNEKKDYTLQRKKLSVSDRRWLESEQDRAIAAYRMAKGQRAENRPARQESSDGEL